MALICSDDAAVPFAHPFNHPVVLPSSNVGLTPLPHVYSAARPQTAPQSSIHVHGDVAKKPSYRTNVGTDAELTAFRGGETRGQS